MQVLYQKQLYSVCNVYIYIYYIVYCKYYQPFLDLYVLVTYLIISCNIHYDSYITYISSKNVIFVDGFGQVLDAAIAGTSKDPIVLRLEGISLTVGRLRV